MSRYEWRALVRFLVLYVGSSLLLIGVIAALYLRMQQASLVENQRLLMQNYAFEVASAAIDAHMFGRSQLVLPQSQGLLVGLYGAQGEPIERALVDHDPRFEADFYAHEGRLYLVDLSAHLHWGIKYIVVESTALPAKITALRQNTALFLAAATLFIFAVALMLSRLFLAPIREEMARRDRFVKDSTHDLSTPVSALLMSLKGLSCDDPKRLRRIMAAARAINDSYQNMVHLFMRDIEHRHDEPLDLRALIEARILWLDDLAQVKGVQIHTTLAPLTIRMDKNRATRLVDNVLQNAVKYTPPGKEITVTLADGVLRICDTGRGIPAADQKRIFGRYERSDQAGGGFGIGLDIVRRICREYAIGLDLHSLEGQGSCFSFCFDRSMILQLHTPSTL